MGNKPTAKATEPPIKSNGKTEKTPIISNPTAAKANKPTVKTEKDLKSKDLSVSTKPEVAAIGKERSEEVAKTPIVSKAQIIKK